MLSEYKLPLAPLDRDSDEVVVVTSDLYMSFFAKSPIVSGSFAKRDLQLKASYATSPPCSGYL